MYRTRIKKEFDLFKKLKILTSGDFRVFTKIGAKMIRDDVIKNINKQITPEGKRLQRNDKDTRLRKQRTLGHSKSLIWTRILIDPSTWLAKGLKKRAKVALKAKRKEIGRILEHRGYHFMGISLWARREILAKFRVILKGGLR